MLAASQCPKCGHLLGLRNSSGKPVPLTHCRSCDTYYPSSRGQCRWCGTTAPTRSGIALSVWGSIGLIVLATAGGVFGGWSIWKRWDANRSGSASTQVASPLDPSVQDASLDTPRSLTPAEADSAAAPAAASLPDTSTHTVQAPSDTALRAPASPGSTESDIRWITATAITWANVRSDANRTSAIVAVISPDTRVRLGDARDGWHRVKAGGIEGWVDRRLFSVDEQRAAR